MRNALLFTPASLLLALLTSGCATHQFAVGTVSYTSSPPSLTDHSGALPLSPLVCIDHTSQPPTFTAGVRLGEHCQLAGFDNQQSGRRGPASGETALRANGDCKVPTATGDLPLQVDNATLEYVGSAVDVAVGGRTNDGRYLTYRFTGMLGQDDPSDDCDAVLQNAAAR